MSPQLVPGTFLIRGDTAVSKTKPLFSWNLPFRVTRERDRQTNTKAENYGKNILDRSFNLAIVCNVMTDLQLGD